MPRVKKVEVKEFVVYDGTNAAEIMAIIHGVEGPQSGSPYIESDDGVTLVIRMGSGDEEILATVRYGDGWTVVGWGYTPREYLNSQSWLTVSGDKSLH